MVWLSVFHEEPQRTAFRAERRVRCPEQRTRFLWIPSYPGIQHSVVWQVQCPPLLSSRFPLVTLYIVLYTLHHYTIFIKWAV